MVIKSGLSVKFLNPIKIAILCVSLILSTSTSHAADKFKAITTFTIIADMARNVAGDVAIVESITKPGAEIHNYQPTPRDIIKSQDADLILWNGLNLELWFEKFFANIKDRPSAVLTDGIEPMGIGKGPYTGKPNPHAWMSPNNALVYVDNIAKAFAKHDPKNADTYLKNAEIYKTKIQGTLKPLRNALDKIPADKRFLVTSEGAFSYLARDVNLEEIFVWPINADQQGTPKQVRDVILAVRKHKIPAVFSESTVPDSSAKQIARETDAKYAGVLYVDSLTDVNGPAATYLDLLHITIETIAKGLTQESSVQ